MVLLLLYVLLNFRGTTIGLKLLIIRLSVDFVSARVGPGLCMVPFSDI